MCRCANALTVLALCAALYALCKTHGHLWVRRIFFCFPYYGYRFAIFAMMCRILLKNMGNYGCFKGKISVLLPFC